MTRSTMYPSRLNARKQNETNKVLKELGLNPAQALRLFFRQLRKARPLSCLIESFSDVPAMRAFSITFITAL